LTHLLTKVALANDISLITRWAKVTQVLHLWKDYH